MFAKNDFQVSKRLILSQLQALKNENQRLKDQLLEARRERTSGSPLRLDVRLVDIDCFVRLLLMLIDPLFSPQAHSKSPNHDHTYRTPSKKPRTPNPPSRLSLSATNSPARAAYGQEPCYNRSDTTFENRPSWDDGDGNHKGFDGGGISNRSRYEQRIVPLPLNNSPARFAENKFEQYPQHQSVQSFSRSCTASSTRMTWSELHNTGNVLRPATPRMVNSGARTIASFPLARTSRPYKRPHPSSHNDFAPFSMSHPPRTPISRNRGALPGYK
ncbi:4146_t:CDS:2 [Acaulospora colombiana]|uniref:4146_t:CDS:1 n=1 Tax=Acaulospora colombiana TaxID=27376 RepID=A0ACA9NAX8_9GLOM|nr:4146_t:CDS:2 [Acaulospora colombiana]